MEDLKRGRTPDGQRLDGLVVYDLDRFTRDNRDLEDAIDVVVHHGRPILDTTGTIDLLTENGRSMARVLVTMANKQSADTSRRQRRKHRALQAAGIPTGGTRPFGWQADKRALDAAEAEEIRKAVKRLLDGAPLSALVADWNGRGVRTSLGNTWALNGLTTMLRNPRMAGYRGRTVHVYNPETQTESRYMEIVRKPDGSPVPGLWEPVLSVQEWEALIAVIGDRYGPAKRGRNSRTYLLSSMLRCSKEGCGKNLRCMKTPERVMARHPRQAPHRYACPSVALGGCGGVSISGPAVDEYISEAVIAKFEAEAARRPSPETTATWQGQPELDRIQTSLKTMTAQWRAGKISDARYFALLPELEDDERRLAAQRQKWLAKANSNVVPREIRDRWPEYSLAERRAYIQAALVAVIVEPTNGTRGRIAERLRLIWREE